MAVLMRQVSDPIPPARSLNPEVDQAISDWIERLLVKDPADRVRSAGEAWDQLEEIVLALVGPRWRRAARLLALRRGPPTGVPAGPARRHRHGPPRPPLTPSLDSPARPTMSEAPTRRVGETGRLWRATVMPRGAGGPLDDDGEPPPRQRPRRRGALAEGRAGGSPRSLVAAGRLRAPRRRTPDARPDATAVRAPTSHRHRPRLALRVPRGWSRVARSAPDLGLPLSRAVAVAPRGARRPRGRVRRRARRAAQRTPRCCPRAFLGSIGQPAGPPPAHTAVRLPTQGLAGVALPRLCSPVGHRSRADHLHGADLGRRRDAGLRGAAGQAAALAAQCDAIAGTLQLSSGRPIRSARATPTRAP